MELILWRHAEAADGAPDASRVLTARGERQARRVAAWLLPHLPRRTRVLASPARRAQQTASALGMPVETDAAVAAGPLEALQAARWPERASCTVLVGHQPTLGQIASLLLTGTQQEIAIRKGALWWFERRVRDGATQVLLRAVIGPDLL